AVFVFVDEPHPEAVVFAPGHFTFRGPVEPERTMIERIGPPVVPQGRQRVLVLPWTAHDAPQIAAGEKRHKSRRNDEMTLEESIHDLFPLLRARRRCLHP